MSFIVEKNVFGFAVSIYDALKLKNKKIKYHNKNKHEFYRKKIKISKKQSSKLDIRLCEREIETQQINLNFLSAAFCPP